MPERTFQVSECEGHCYMFNVIYNYQKERFSVSESKRRYIRQDGESPNPPTILYLTIPQHPTTGTCAIERTLGWITVELMGALFSYTISPYLLSRCTLPAAALLGAP